MTSRAHFSEQVLRVVFYIWVIHQGRMIFSDLGIAVFDCILPDSIVTLIRRSPYPSLKSMASVSWNKFELTITALFSL